MRKLTGFLMMTGFLLTSLLLVGCPGILVTPSSTASPAPSSSPAPTQDPANPVFNPSDLPDGWARAPGTGFPSSPGGAAATAENTFTVTNKTELIAALSKDTTDRIIYVNGVIDLLGGRDGDWYVANTTGLSQVYANYTDYMNKYAASCYDGALALLDADQEKLYNKMKADAYVYIPSNTTIIGLGVDSGFKYGQVLLSNVTNVVIRNIHITDALDWFPLWYQSNENNFNAELDCMTISGSTYVWIDHCTIGNGERPYASMPSVTIGSGRSEKWVSYDGLLDIVRASNYITLSWNIFENHDKTTLIGNSDTRTTDAGTLKVTYHHNWFRSVAQRLPRVRFGQVHLYNNYYQDVSSYAVGVGVHARIYSEANYFQSVGNAFARYDSSGNEGYYIDFNSVFNNLGNGRVGTLAQIGWEPAAVYSYTASSAADAKTVVMAGAGAGN